MASHRVIDWRVGFLVFFFVSLFTFGNAQDTLTFKGQLSAWANYNSDNTLKLMGGVRYIPTLDYGIKLKSKKLIDFEGSANIFGSAGWLPSDTSHFDGKIKPYRAWIRYSGTQFEVRAGLQKINFGSATMLRPLMWFDQLDPRDPLQLTDGVWGILGRYYFLNNANIWLWSLYGNDKARAWDTGKPSKDFPEFGGRFQMPVPRGEAAISYHFRQADTRGLVDSIPSYARVNENRIGIDGKWDVGVGLWFEGSWINKSRNLGIYTNQEMLCLGSDYTFSIGNGLNIIAEHLLGSFDQSAFTFTNSFSFSALSLSYPVGMIDNLSTISYFDWINHNIYNFITWKRQYNNLTFYVMAYSNPKNFVLPQQPSSGNLFAGKGIQIMFVFNH